MSTLFRIFISRLPKTNTGIIFPYGLFSRNINTKPKPKEKITSYILTKYLEFVKKSETLFEKRFPTAFKFYRVFSVGYKDFKNDLFSLFDIYKKVNTTGIQSLCRKELEIYHQMPKDMIKVAPVLFIVALPFGAVIFPVAFMFPKKLLSYHFWSLQQRSEFAMTDLKKRLSCYRPVLRCMQTRLRTIKDNPLHKCISNVLGSLGSGVHPSIESILICKPLFECEPFSMKSMNYNHLGALLRIYDMHRFWRRKRRLEDRAKIIHYMDMAIIREGGVEKMNQDEIKWACFFRGLNPINVRNEDLAQWLNNWLYISQNIDENSLSLLLHCPILTAYNQPSNWSLLHDPRT